MHPVYPVYQALRVLQYVLVVPGQHEFELPELSLVDGLDEVVLVLGVVEQGPRLPRGAQLYQRLVVVRPDQVQD